MATKLPEVWMRGPLPGIPALLQPVAHALLQTKEEVVLIMQDFADEYLFNKIAGVASPGFHLQHMAGVLDRLFTYAANMQLNDKQLSYLANEGRADPSLTTQGLVSAFEMAVNEAIEKLKLTDEKTLTDFRGIGRKQLPSTVIGLLFHAAEHTMRHTGQLLVTVKVLNSYNALI